MSTYSLTPGIGLLLTDMGVSVHNVLRRADLPGDLLSRSSTRVPAEQFFALVEAIDAEYPGDDLAVTMARALSAEAFDVPIFAALNSPDLLTAAQRLATYKPLIGPLRLTILDDENTVTIVAKWPAMPPVPAALVALEMTFWVGLARLGLRDAVGALRIESTCSLPGAEAIGAFTGAQVLIGSENRVVFSREVATRPFLTAKATMWSFFEPELRRQLAELGTDATVSERVSTALLELLPGGQPSMQAVGKRLGLSTRTLQRRLKGEGTSFQSALSSTREQLARHYLTRSTMPAAEISFLLGYADPNSFYRAFHEWTGETPETVRQAAAC